MKRNRQNPIRKPATAVDHRSRINRVAAFVLQHLDESFELGQLARIACFSPYHFHRIFAAHMGETVGEYVRRMRLERAARWLTSTGRSITRIALDSGYDTPYAFTKSFRALFGMTPSRFRIDPGSRENSLSDCSTRKIKNRRCFMKCEIRALPDQTVAYVCKTGLINHDFTQAAGKAFDVLCAFIQKRKLWGSVTVCLGICPDDPDTTPPEQCRYEAGFILKPHAQIQPEGEVRLKVIPGGRWAVFLHQGPYDTLWQTWNAVYRDWFPTSGVKLRDTPPYEVYLDDKRHTPPERLRTEIYIPIQ